MILYLVTNSLTHAGIIADSVMDWQAAKANDGVVFQGELNWEYGYISTYTGAGGAFYGWHQNSFYWENSSGIIIYWPNGQTPPDIAWGEGGDSTGCRPPMTWIDGGYPWAGSDTNKWASVRRWTSSYTGLVKISGQIGRYFDTSIIMGWDIDFSVALNADLPGTPAIYTKYMQWNDVTTYSFVVDKVPIKAGDTICFIINPASWNANNCYIKMTATIAATSPEPVGDFNLDHCVNMLDFSMFASHWLQNAGAWNNWCQGADINHSSYVDINDLTVFISHWLETSYPVGDLNFDNNVNMLDFAVFASNWLRAGCIAEDWCGYCDLDHSGEVNFLDLSKLVSNWLK